jgi:enamine deaminase RidA (YjgF/YER057c/UK114 family)
MPITDRIVDVPGVAPGTGYAHAVTVTGQLAFIAGQVAMDVDGQLVGDGDMGTQAAQALSNLSAVMQTLGAGWADVVRLGWYVTDVTQLQEIRGVRDDVLRPALGERPNPSSTLVEVASLFRPGFLVEVDAVVALPD